MIDKTNKTEFNSHFVVYSQKLAGILMYRGFVLLGLGKDKANETKNVFYFKDTPQIREVVSEFKSKGK
jgi:hypothetical protein